MKCEFLCSNVPCQMSSKMWVTSHFHNFKGNQPLLYRTLNEPCQVIKSLGPQGTFRKLLIIIHEQQKHRHEHPDFNHRHFLTHLWARFLFRVSSLEPSQESQPPNKLQMFIRPSQFAPFKCFFTMSEKYPKTCTSWRHYLFWCENMHTYNIPRWTSIVKDHWICKYFS